MLSLVPVPLTLWAAFAGPTVSNPGLVDHPQAAVLFLSSLLEEEFLPFWATNGSICLECKVLA
jgi:hypothetical protein